MRYLFIHLLLVLGIATHAQSNASSRAALKNTIESLNKELAAAFNANDMQKVAAFYADDSEIAGDNYSVKGRKNIDNYWLALKDKGRGWKLEVVEVGGSGDYVYQLGQSDLTYLSGNNPSPTRSVTNFIVLWKLQADGSYKIFKDYITDTQFRKKGQ